MTYQITITYPYPHRVPEDLYRYKLGTTLLQSASSYVLSTNRHGYVYHISLTITPDIPLELADIYSILEEMIDPYLITIHNLSDNTWYDRTYLLGEGEDEDHSDEVALWNEVSSTYYIDPDYVLLAIPREQAASIRELLTQNNHHHLSQQLAKQEQITKMNQQY
ncbi:MAG: hypothetical protein AAF125_01225 [Chloroflexota bacterium]